MAELHDESDLRERMVRLQEQLKGPAELRTSHEPVTRVEEEVKEIVDRHMLNERVVRLEEQAKDTAEWQRFDRRLVRVEERLDHIVDLQRKEIFQNTLAIASAIALGMTGSVLAVLAILKVF
jgi:hypothetical protein